MAAGYISTTRKAARTLERASHFAQTRDFWTSYTDHIEAQDELRASLGAPPSAGPKYTFLEMEATLNLWEAALEIRPGSPAIITDFLQCWEDFGTVHMRSMMPELSGPLLRLYDALSEQEREDFGSYDWEFCPWFLSTIGWNTKTGKPHVPGDAPLLAKARQYLACEALRRAELARNYLIPAWGPKHNNHDGGAA